VKPPPMRGPTTEAKPSNIVDHIMRAYLGTLAVCGEEPLES
jgi:hypothetical protein